MHFAAFPSFQCRPQIHFKLVGRRRFTASPRCARRKLLSQHVASGESGFISLATRIPLTQQTLSNWRYDMFTWKNKRKFCKSIFKVRIWRIPTMAKLYFSFNFLRIWLAATSSKVKWCSCVGNPTSPLLRKFPRTETRSKSRSKNPHSLIGVAKTSRIRVLPIF